MVITNESLDLKFGVEVDYKHADDSEWNVIYK
jgi:hypothetical protein